MKDLGRMLREKREHLGISLDELQTRTKIRKRYLIALEDGDWDLLPGDVYARGFVRSYAEVVGLDGKELLTSYIDDNPTPTEHTVDAPKNDSPSEDKPSVSAPKMVAPVPSSKPPKPKAKPPQQKTVRVSPPGMSSARTKGRSYVGETVAVVAILAVIAGAWWAIGGSGKGNAANNDLASGLTNHTTPNATVNNTAAGAPNNTTTNADNTTDNSTGGSTLASTVHVVSQSFANNQQTYVVSTSDPLTVQLSTTNDQCWIQVFTDGKETVPSDTVAASGTRSWTAAQQVRIKLGNVPAVALQVNGQALVLPNTRNAIWVTITKGQTG